MEQGNTKLRELQEKVSRKKKIEAMLADLMGQLEALRRQTQELGDICQDEQADVDRLEKPGLTAFVYSVINRKERKLEKERGEAAAAALKYQTALQQTEATESEIDALQKELAGLQGIEAWYASSFRAEKEALKASDPVRAEKICGIEARLGELSAQVRETDEALAAGRSALSYIGAVEKELGSAEGWGTFDLFGGGLLADVAKHSRLDSAQMQIHDLQNVLRRYRTELTDVAIEADIQASVDGFLKFADFFFDGLFADMAVLDRIQNAQAQMHGVHSQVENLQGRLETMKNGLTAEARGLENELSDIVTG